MKTQLHILIVLSILLSGSLSAQTAKWAIGSKCPFGDVEPHNIIMDAWGNIYSAGSFLQSGSGSTGTKFYFGADSLTGSGAYLVRLDSDGNYKWGVGAPTNFLYKTEVAADPYGYVYLFSSYVPNLTVGGYSLSATSESCFCAKIDSSGNVVWLKNIGDSASFYACASDGSGNLYLTGTYFGHSITLGSTTLTSNSTAPNRWNIFLCKMDTSGKILWAQNIGGNNDDYCMGLAATNTGDVYVMGTYSSASITIGSTVLANPTAGAIAYGFLAKYDTYGAPKWGKRTVNSVGSSGSPYAFNNLTVDNLGNPYVTGGYVGISSFDKDTLPSAASSFAYLTKYDVSGNVKWTKTLSNPNYAMGCSMTSDACGNIWVGTLNSSYIGFSLLNYDTSGSFKGAANVAADDCNEVADNRGNLYVTGDFVLDNSVFGKDTLHILDNTKTAQFVAKYSYPFCDTSKTKTGLPKQTEQGSGITMYPNPATDELTITLQNEAAKLSRAEIYDLTGRLIIQQQLSGTICKVSVKDINPGVYICRVYTDQGAGLTQKLFIAN
jgi:type IX secretion system substrate protein